MKPANELAADYFHAGTELLAAGQVAAAATVLREALRLAPELAAAQANLALALAEQGQADAAEVAYRQALALAPESAETHVNFGVLLAGQRRTAEAEAAYRRALELAPGVARAWSNLGALLLYARRAAEAEDCFRTAVALDPAYRTADFNLACLLLQAGAYEEGWRRFEQRDWYRQLEAHLGLPRWRGEALAGKALLIGLEAGHGDMIQFCRYAREAKAQGARRVSVLCHPALSTLFQRLEGVDEVIPLGEPGHDGSWDFWSPPMSLPHYFGTTLANLPAALPYLSAAPDRLEYWAGKLGPAGTALRVGLVWKGSPGFENDAERSLASLQLLAPLGAVAGVRFVSLQKGAGEHEAGAADAPFPLLDLGSQVGDFADQAAIISQLDLVIAVDTALAHLSGALGKACWLLLPDYKTDWRWLDGREDSPWYPGVMRLFRQGADGAWPPVIEPLRAALAALAGAR